ncbi:MAG: glycoside hydrolase family 140 protein [Cyclobacteriaceae bacterium]|nr:glycoside hydrolase family 140 protein [Cyclobacteriaceae bacterium]
MRLTTTIFAFIWFLSGPQLNFAQPVGVSENGRYLVNEDGKPFFYLGDTAWELFHRLNREEADLYLADRADKGFTVIQAVVLSQIGGLDEPNANGHLPLKDNDPGKPNEDYFRHVDYIVDKAASLNLVIGMLPTWGSYWSSLDPDQVIFTVENAMNFGRFLGKRYKDKPVIWILGGDNNIHTEGERQIIESMARGLKEGDEGRHLVTFHPRGPGLSSDYFHAAEWLDFNMFQSSHAAHDHDNGLFTENDYALEPIKPTLDGEPRYENLQTGFYLNGFNRLDRFDDYDVRQAAYWSILAGACGHTYGHSSIWQMYAPDRDPIIAAVIPWYDALDHPGAFQMGHIRKLFELRPFQVLVPNQGMIKNGPLTGGSKIRAALAEDASFAIVYSPRGESFSIDKSLIESRYIKEIWFDPRYGVSYHLHTGDTRGIQTYTPPTSGRGQDWILILENASLELPMPGHH